jgi:hypothetical protein
MIVFFSNPAKEQNPFFAGLPLIPENSYQPYLQ